jgi:hypothetical protein
MTSGKDDNKSVVFICSCRFANTHNQLPLKMYVISAADPALARSPNENIKLWNNNKNTGGNYIHETLPKP